MPKRYSSAELIKMIEADGWVLDRVKGSYHHFRHPEKQGLVTIVHPEKDTPQGTANTILKSAGLK
jgi:predicted RNA binding protein YcfA (HicA-like mRNA interferase family)